MDQTEVLSTVINVISEALLVEASVITEEVGPGDIAQWDSLGHQSVLVSLEKKFGVSFSIDEVLDMESTEDIVEAIHGKISQK